MCLHPLILTAVHRYHVLVKTSCLLWIWDFSDGCVYRVNMLQLTEVKQPCVTDVWGIFEIYCFGSWLQPGHVNTKDFLSACHILSESITLCIHIKNRPHKSTSLAKLNEFSLQKVLVFKLDQGAAPYSSLCDLPCSVTRDAFRSFHSPIWNTPSHPQGLLFWAPRSD